MDETLRELGQGDSILVRSIFEARVQVVRIEIQPGERQYSIRHVSSLVSCQCWGVGGASDTI
ncbi:MAG: hypothetical protein IID36_04915 [Planctomycetes bacterium]|nr:hypothetical protein [Planctomycetota bacterium]